MMPLPSSAETYRRLTGIDPAVSGKRIGAEYAVPCVNAGAHQHGDKTPSLHISVREKGWTCRVCAAGGGALELVKFAGKATTDAEALAWLGVEKEPARRAETPRRIVATYAYRTADGVTAYEVLRYEPKDFRQRRRVDGREIWNLDGVSRIPYRLPEAIAGIAAGRTLVVVEGEKDADSLAQLGFVATTNAGGAAYEWTAAFVQPFFGVKRAIVVADNDDAGRTAARKRAYALREICGDVRLLEYLPVPPKGDVSDLIAQGWDRARLTALLESAEPVRGEIERLSEVIRRQQAAPPPPPPIRTGFRCIDDAMGGLRRGQTSVFAGRPGGGKSALGEHLAAYIAENHRVLYCSLEMGTDRSVDRLVARLTSMHEAEYLRRGRPVEATSFESLDLHFTEYAALSDIAAAMHKIRPDFVIIDHARELEGWFKVERGSRADISAAVIMGQIVQLGKSSGAHMCLLSQCTRGANGKRPALSDLRDSGAVEEKADNVFFIHRPFQYDEREPDNNAELVCWKSRGKGGYIGHLRWLGETMLFDDPPADEMWIYSRCCSSNERAKVQVPA